MTQRHDPIALGSHEIRMKRRISQPVISNASLRIGEVVLMALGEPFGTLFGCIQDVQHYGIRLTWLLVQPHAMHKQSGFRSEDFQLGFEDHEFYPTNRIVQRTGVTLLAPQDPMMLSRPNQMPQNDFNPLSKSSAILPQSERRASDLSLSSYGSSVPGELLANPGLEPMPEISPTSMSRFMLELESAPPVTEIPPQPQAQPMAMKSQSPPRQNGINLPAPFPPVERGPDALSFEALLNNM